jgi:hypothetical protein
LPEPTQEHKELIMNTFVATASRDLTCGAAAALITLILGMSFVESTSVAPGSRAPVGSTVAGTPVRAWFGQPAPAVLVD